MKYLQLKNNKAKLSLYLTKHHVMKKYWGWRYSAGTHWTGGWVGPRAGLDAAEKRKIPSPYRKSNS